MNLWTPQPNLLSTTANELLPLMNKTDNKVSFTVPAGEYAFTPDIRIRDNFGFALSGVGLDSSFGSYQYSGTGGLETASSGIRSVDNKTVVVSNIMSAGNDRIFIVAPATLNHLAAVQLFEVPGEIGSIIPLGTNCHHYEVNNSRSQSGRWLGSTSFDLGEQTTVSMVNIPSSWMEENYDTLCGHLTSAPFYFQYNSTSRQIAYVWLDGDFPQPKYTSATRCSFSFRLVG